MTKEEIMALPVFTPVRIKKSVDCHQMFKDGGKLVFQKQWDCEEKEQTFGILVQKGACYDFPAKLYELLTN